MVAEPVYPVPRWLREYLVDVVLLLVGQGVQDLKSVEILLELADMTSTKDDRADIRVRGGPCLRQLTGEPTLRATARNSSTLASLAGSVRKSWSHSSFCRGTTFRDSILILAGQQA